MKKLFPLLLLLILSGSIFAQETLTLKEAISVALNRNTSLIKSKNNLTTNKKAVKSAYGDLLPDLGVNSSFSWSRNVDEGGKQVDFFGRETVIPPSESDTRNWNLRAGGNVTLFNGLANYANISASKNELKAAQYDISKLKKDIVYQTTEYYYAVLEAKELLDVRRENVKYNEKFLESVNTRYDVGSVPIADVYAQQVALGNAELALIQAENNYEQAKSTFLNYLALDVLKDYELKDPFDEDIRQNTDEYMQDFGELEDLVREALKNREDYKAQEYYVESTMNGITIAQSGFYPTITGDYGISTRAVKPNEFFDSETYSLGLSLNLPIFSNWNTEEQLQSAEVRVKNAKEDLRALERQIKIEVKQGYLDLTAAKKRLDVAVKNVKSAEENRKVNSERYKLGSANILDVLQADKDYTQALNDMISAEFQFYSLKDKLLNTIGKLNTQDYK